jgi:hypothetical protein
MKNYCLIIVLLFSFQINAQKVFRYQLKANIIPVENFQYAGASRIGFETVNRKFNFGIDLLAYPVSSYENTRYYKDSFFHRQDLMQTVNSFGIAFNISRALNFNINKNRFIYGCQLFLGLNRQFEERTTYDFDTVTGLPSQSVISQGGYAQTYKITEHGAKFSFGGIPFARLELAINKRFTFSPEFQLPFCINNKIGGYMDFAFMPGFNFCLGYKLGKAGL